MRLPTPFIQLPLRFDAARLRAEIEQFPEQEWRPHPQGFPGNSALILVSRGGGDNDELSGSMAPSPRLARCPYLCQVLASFRTVIGRSRLMRLAPGAEVTPHSDIDYYWRERVRIHVPIVTDPSVRFNCDGTEIHMAAGEAWIFDNWRPHRVINPSGITRIHLVVDTVGSADFWRLAARGTLPGSTPEPVPAVAFDGRTRANFPLERFNAEPLAHPAAVRSIAQELIAELRALPARGPREARIEQLLLDLAHEWQALWSVYGPDPSGYPHYALLLQSTLRSAGEYGGELRLPSNRMYLNHVLQRFLPPLFGAFGDFFASLTPPHFDRPLIIVAAPRSGSTLLFETLARHPDLWSLPDESHGEIENIPALAPRARNYESNALTAEDASAENRSALLRAFTLQLADGRGRAFLTLPENERPASVRLVEKTPKNTLRIAFFNALFPDARFLFLYREASASLGSMLEAWRSGRFVTYRDLPDWPGPPWSLLLTPGWRALKGQPLAEVVSQQWCSANEAALTALAALPRERWRVLDYDTLVKEPVRVLERACEFLGLARHPEIEAEIARGLPLSRHTLSPPAGDKWRRHEAELATVLPRTNVLMEKLKSLDNRL